METHPIKGAPLIRHPSRGYPLICYSQSPIPLFDICEPRDLGMNNWVYLGLAIFSEVIATASLKSTEGFTRLVPSIVVIAGYSAAFFFLSLTLDTIPIGVAYAVWSGVGVATIAIVSYVLYGQKIDTAGVIGIGLIIAGVVVLRLFSESTAEV